MRAIVAIGLEGENANKDEHGTIGHHVSRAPHTNTTADEGEQRADATNHEHPLVRVVHRIAPTELAGVHTLAQVWHIYLTYRIRGSPQCVQFGFDLLPRRTIDLLIQLAQLAKLILFGDRGRICALELLAVIAWKLLTLKLT